MANNVVRPDPAASLQDRRLIEGVVANLAFLSEIPPGQVAAVARHCWVLPARRGDTLARQGEPVPGLFIVAYGLVKLALRGPENDERVLRLVSAGQTFGESAALLGRACGYEALALVDAKLVVIPPVAIFSLLDREPRFGRSLVKMLAERMFELLAEVESVTMQRSAQRLASYLGSLVEPPNGDGLCTVRLPVTKTLVAARLGVKKETLSRLLRQLAAEGVIAVIRRDIAILDRTRLAEMAGTGRA